MIYILFIFFFIYPRLWGKKINFCEQHHAFQKTINYLFCFLNTCLHGIFFSQITSKTIRVIDSKLFKVIYQYLNFRIRKKVI